jgi:hypothetical protein
MVIVKNVAVKLWSTVTELESFTYSGLFYRNMSVATGI